MSQSPLGLRAALKRGATIAAANWPVVLIDFVLETFYKAALTVPILGGALMVAAIVGTDLAAVVGEGVRATADLVMSSLGLAPVALMSFLAAVAIVGIGGAAVMFAVKAGTLSVLVDSERRAGDMGDAQVLLDSLSRASTYSVAAVYHGTARFTMRAVALACGLGVAYFVIGLGYFGVLWYGLALVIRLTWLPAWPLLVLAATTTGVVAIAAVDLAHNLMRVIVVSDDCTVREGFARLRRFVGEDARHVIAIFSVVSVVLLAATAASVAAAGALALVAWVPVVGLIVLPLQAVAWILRGLVLQYMTLTALVAYQAQYRRFAAMRR